MIAYLSPVLAARTPAPEWPPDAYAIVAAVLRKADAYPTVVEKWPPAGSGNWLRSIRRTGARWRKSVMAGRAAPRAVQAWWNTVRQSDAVPIGSVRERRSLCEALLQICAAADEASYGAGILDMTEVPDDFESEAYELLTRDSVHGSTLCREIEPSRMSVLPKLHTPQVGITLRSLSHHLALVEPSDVAPHWTFWPSQPKEPNRLNLLLLPWPLVLEPRHFAPSRGRLDDMPASHRFFTSKGLGKIEVSEVRKVMTCAENIAGHIDVIVFPELALSGDEPERLSWGLKRAVIGGWRAPARGRQAGRNEAVALFPLGASLVGFRQHKHHRWKLTQSQIAQYALNRQLKGPCNWWEHIHIPRRELSFLSVDKWLTYCVLICEDLARQDPVSELVRSVGPDLVVALLMDGPQLARRWPSRYAGVLADDPGCSVLTLTSLGMVRLSCTSGMPESRVVAMWKDSGREAKELSLFHGASGMVLSLNCEKREEFAADGRSDGKISNYLTLEQVHQVYV